MNAELLVDARMRALSLLSGPTIHELRGAANVLALHLQLLSIEPKDDDALERRRRSLAAADDGRRRLFDIAETFVRLATVPDAAEGDLDLAAVVADAVALARPYALQRRVTVTLAPAPVARVRGRRDVVSQTVLDLVLALLERSPNGATLDIAVRAQARDVHALLRPSTSEALDPALIARIRSALQWAGGTLRLSDVGVTVQLPAAPPGESS